MKVVAKSMEVLASFDIKGNLQTIRFRITNENKSNQVVNIDRIIDRTQEKLVGIFMTAFTCQRLIDNIEKRYEIK